MLGEVQAHHGLPINPVDFARATLRFGLVEVVYEWAKVTVFKFYFVAIRCGSYWFSASLYFAIKLTAMCTNLSIEHIHSSRIEIKRSMTRHSFNRLH